ncbi:DUF3080 domain-containing protein [Salinisphaera aquimarina]
MNGVRTGASFRLWCVLILLVIGGCSATDSPEARFDDYLSRLARTLDVSSPSSQAPPRLRYPDKRSLQLVIETPRTGWIGLFQLHRCGLVNLVSERNSILGRVAPPQDRLAYESRLLAGLKQCRTELDSKEDTADDRDLRRQLDALIEIKRRAVPRIFWNLTLADDAMAHLFSVAPPPLGLKASALGRASRQALTRLADAGRTLAEGGLLDASALSKSYEILEGSTYGGQLQSAALVAVARLDAATAMLQQRMARRPICFNAQPNRRARTLYTILREVYGPNVQSYLADLVRAGREWRAAVASLVDAQQVAPRPAFTAYETRTLSAKTGVWAALDTAIVRHTKSWQDAMGQCNLMPGE